MISKYVTSCVVSIGLACLMFLPSVTAAAVYYVATNGSNTNPGSAQQPFQTIQHAADIARAGDTVKVQAGLYRERITVKASGTPSNPITFEGESNVVLDGGTVVKGWTTAPEIGPGVYKQSNMPFTASNMTWKNKYILQIDTAPMDKGEGFQAMKRPASDPAWNGLEALFGHYKGVTYVRMRNGENPDNEDITFAPGYQGAFQLDTRDYIVLRGFTIRNAWSAVLMDNGANDNVVEKNYLIGGHKTVLVRRGSARNHVRDNEITLDYIYTRLGDPTDGLSLYPGQIWQAFKNLSTSDRHGVALWNAGDDNQIYRNHIFRHWGGVQDWVEDGMYKETLTYREYIATFCRRLKVYENVLEYIADDALEPTGGEEDAEWHDNVLYDHGSIRLKDPTKGPMYVYRNRASDVYLPLYYPSTTPIYIYHNTFAGPKGTSEGGLAVAFSYLGAGLPTALGENIWFINNIFSNPSFWTDYSGKWGTGINKTHLDYNWIGGSYHTTWAPTSKNIIAKNQWLWSLTGPRHDFTLTATSPARGIGIDLSQPTTIDGKSLPALPGMRAGYFTGTRPDAGAVQFSTSSSAIVPPRNLRVE